MPIPITLFRKKTQRTITTKKISKEILIDSLGFKQVAGTIYLIIDS